MNPLRRQLTIHVHSEPGSLGLPSPQAEGAAAAAARLAGRWLRWSLRAPADRLTLPAAAAVWLAGTILRASHVPALYVGAVAAVALPAVAYAVMHYRSHGHGKSRDEAAWRASKAAMAVLVAGVWLTCAAHWGVLAGPWCITSLVFLVLAASGYALVRADDVTRGRRDWRGEKTRWHTVSKLYGLQGSHLLHSEATRLGRAMIVDVTGTGRRASHLAARDTAERIAEHKRLPASRVQVHPDAIAGRIRISIRDRDPWAHPVPHPVLDDDPEIQLPATQSVTDPIVVGQDPEAGRPLEITLYDEDGAKGLMIVGITGAGKTVLLNDIMERLTSCDDVLVWDINLSKAKENRRWAPACDLTAHGPHARRDALAILRLAKKVIEFRGMSETDDAVHIPAATDPAIVIRVDEMDELQGGSDQISMAIKEVLNKINSKKRSEGVILIEAAQRGVITHTGSADIRANFDTFAVAKVRGRSEMMHAMGDLGLDLPDMTTYGEGQPGVWAIATLGGEYQAGRTFFLKHLGDITRLAEARPPRATLPPALREYLGDAYERLKTGQVTAHVVSDEPARQPWMTDLEKELSQVSEDVFEQMDRIRRTNDETRARLDAIDAAQAALPELTPEQEEFYRHAVAEREKQAAATVDIPAEHRENILRLARDGASSGELVRFLGVSRQTIWRYMFALRVEGVVELRGRGRGARWHMKDDPAA